MIFTVHDLQKKIAGWNSEIQIFTFGSVALVSDDRYLVDGLSFDRIVLLDDEETLDKVLSSYKDNGYKVAFSYDINLPRGDLATKLALDFDKFHNAYDPCVNFTSEDYLDYLAALSYLRSSIASGSTCDLVAELEDFIENNGDMPEFVAKAVSLKERILAHPKDANTKKEGENS